MHEAGLALKHFSGLRGPHPEARGRAWVVEVVVVVYLGPGPLGVDKYLKKTA